MIVSFSQFITPVCYFKSGHGEIHDWTFVIIRALYVKFRLHYKVF